MIRRLTLFVLIAVLASLAILACGGDDDEDEDAGANAESTPTAASEDAAPTNTETESQGTVATATTSSEGEVLESVLVIPEPRSESIPRSGRVLGESGAPVSIVEYGDFQ